MKDLLMLIALVITSIGAAALVLALSKVILISLPEIFIRVAGNNSTPSATCRQRSKGQNKAGSCPYCQ